MTHQYMLLTLFKEKNIHLFYQANYNFANNQLRNNLSGKLQMCHYEIEIIINLLTINNSTIKINLTNNQLFK